MAVRSENGVPVFWKRAFGVLHRCQSATFEIDARLFYGTVMRAAWRSKMSLSSDWQRPRLTKFSLNATWLEIALKDHVEIGMANFFAVKTFNILCPKWLPSERRQYSQTNLFDSSVPTTLIEIDTSFSPAVFPLNFSNHDIGRGPSNRETIMRSS